jgi:signal transduction histidine kinase
MPSNSHSPGGNIHVSAVQQAGTIVFAVQDTGIGIPQKDIDRIFERFLQDRSFPFQSGTGLGLSIARHLVQAHQRKIWVESVVNQGSTFISLSPFPLNRILFTKILNQILTFLSFGVKS